MVEFGAPGSVRVLDRPRPSAADDSVVVEVTAAGVNRSDLLNVAGVFGVELPRIPGRDFAGVVVEGPAEMCGKRVWGAGGDDLGFAVDGSHAEFLRLPRTDAVECPLGVPVDRLGVSGVAFMTASRALFECAELARGETVLVVGGAGGVGGAAAQIAIWHGARVLATTAQGKSLPPGAEPLGEMLDGAELVDGVCAATDGAGVDVALDTAVGAPLLKTVSGSMADGGRIVSITSVPGDASLDLLDFYRRELRLLGLNTSLAPARVGVAHLAALAPGFASGALQPLEIAHRFSLEEAPDAYTAVAAGGLDTGRIALIPGSRSDGR
jgi:NADPH:quinone reductase-like Zn-dependent oxidoreductase